MNGDSGSTSASRTPSPPASGYFVREQLSPPRRTTYACVSSTAQDGSSPSLPSTYSDRTGCIPPASGRVSSATAPSSTVRNTTDWLFSFQDWGRSPSATTSVGPPLAACILIRPNAVSFLLKLIFRQTTWVPF